MRRVIIFTRKRRFASKTTKNENEPPACKYVYFATLEFHRPPCGRTGAGGNSAETLLQ